MKDSSRTKAGASCSAVVYGALVIGGGGIPVRDVHAAKNVATIAMMSCMPRGGELSGDLPPNFLGAAG